MLIGVNANAVLGQQYIHDKSRVIDRCRLHSGNERGVTFASWPHSNNLAASNSMFQKPYDRQWTHQLWSTGSQRQIDIIFVDNFLRGAMVDSATSDEF